MSRISLVLFLSASLSGIAIPALAANCSTTATAGIYSADVDSDEYFLLSAKPSLVMDVSRTCGEFTYEVTPTTELSSQGKYGERGYGDQVNFVLTYDHTIATPVGPVQLEVSGAYWKENRFDRSDALIPVYVEGARTFTFGKITVTPFVRAMQWIGIGNIPTDTFLRPGVRFAVPISEKISITAEASNSFNFTEHLSNAYSNVTVTRDFGKGWKGSVVVQPNEKLRSVVGFNVSKTW